MFFDYETKQFIANGRPERLLFQGFPHVTYGVPHHQFDISTTTAATTNTLTSTSPDFQICVINGVLKIIDVFGMQIYSTAHIMEALLKPLDAPTPSYETATYNNQETLLLFTEAQLKTIHVAIDHLAVTNSIVIPEGIALFTDRLMLYQYPLLRSLTNSHTNFYKIARLLPSLSPHLLQQTSVSNAAREYLGTSSKVILKWLMEKLIVKTDLTNHIGPELLGILLAHTKSGKMLGELNLKDTDVRILTTYEDVELLAFEHVRFLMDIFQNNVDHVHKALLMKVELETVYKQPSIIKFLQQQLTAQKILNILSDKNFCNSISDTTRQFNQFNNPESIPKKLQEQYPRGLELPKNWKTLKELHDKVSADYNKIKTAADTLPIVYTDLELKLQGLKQDNIELILPEETATIALWGKEQQHCVASYADRAARKELMIVAILVGGVHKYTMELRLMERAVMEGQVVQPTELNALPSFSEPVQRKVVSYSIQQLHGISNSSPESNGDVTLRKTLNEMLCEVFEVNAVVTSNKDVNHVLDAMNYMVGGLGNVAVAGE